MFTLRVGSQAYNIVRLLAVVGEFPMNSVYLLGNARVYKRTITMLSVEQKFRNPKTGEILKTKLLNISGENTDRNIRLYIGALPILNWLGFLDYYNAVFYEHAIPGNKAHKNRNHRIAEVYAMCMRAGIFFPPYVVPILQDEERKRLFSDTVAFYSSRHLKNVSVGEMEKIKFIRIVGAVFAYGSCYAVYNMRNEVLRWHGTGEIKTRVALTEISRMNCSSGEVDSAILFGRSQWQALQTVLASAERHGKDFRLDIIYQTVHFIELSENGIRTFRFFRIPNWKEKMRLLLFEETDVARGDTRIECDAYVNGKYILSYLDGDMAKLIRFYNGTRDGREEIEIICYPFQEEFVRNYFGRDTVVKTISLDVIEKAMGIEGGVN